MPPHLPFRCTRSSVKTLRGSSDLLAIPPPEDLEEDEEVVVVVCGQKRAAGGEQSGDGGRRVLLDTDDLPEEDRGQFVYSRADGSSVVDPPSPVAVSSSLTVRIRCPDLLRPATATKWFPEKKPVQLEYHVLKERLPLETFALSGCAGLSFRCVASAITETAWNAGRSRLPIHVHALRGADGKWWTASEEASAWIGDVFDKSDSALDIQVTSSPAVFQQFLWKFLALVREVTGRGSRRSLL